jgi:hypothetical protein
VASSMRRTLGCLRSARARQRSWRWPCDRFAPDSETGELRFRNGFLLSTWKARSTGSSVLVAVPSGMMSTVSSVAPPCAPPARMERGFVVEAEQLVLISETTALAVGLGISTACGLPGGWGVAAPDVAADADDIRWTSRRTVKISSSVKSSKGSRLLRIEPVKSVGSGQQLVLTLQQDGSTHLAVP